MAEGSNLEKQIVILGSELPSVQKVETVLATAAPIADEKKRLSPVSDGLSLMAISERLRLGGILADPERELQQYGLTLTPDLSVRRKADIATALAAVRLMRENAHPKKTVAAALLLGSNYPAQAEIAEIMATARKTNNNYGQETDLQLIQTAVGDTLARGVREGKVDRLLAACAAEAVNSGVASRQIALEAARAIALRQAPATGEIAAVSAHILEVYDIARSLRNNQSRAGLKNPNTDIAYHRFGMMATRLREEALGLEDPVRSKEFLQRLVEAGKIPDRIQSLQEVVTIVDQNPEIRGVSFDLYDTLVQWTSNQMERRGHHARRCWQLAEKAGIHLSENQMQDIMRGVWQRRWDDFQAKGIEVPIETSIDDAINRLGSFGSISSDTKRRLQGSFTKEWYRVEIETAVVIPGARETLDELKKRGIKICLTSNASWSTQHVRHVLHRFGLLNYFDAISISSETGYMKKPKRPELPHHADFFHYSWRKLGVAPEHILHVGDNPWDDAEGARDAGAKSVQYSDPSSYNRIETQRQYYENPTLLAQTTVAMEQEALNRDFPSWLRVEESRRKIPEIERTRVDKMASEVYRRSREIFAPAYIAVAEDILQSLQRGEADQVLCLSRDGLPFSVVLKLLRNDERDIYDNVSVDKIKYVYTNRSFLERITSPQTAQDVVQRERYFAYLRQKGVLDPKNKRTILTDLICASGKTQDLLKTLLAPQEVTGSYLENHQFFRSDAKGFLQTALGRNDYMLIVETALLLFESLLNGPKNSVTAYDVVEAHGATIIQPQVEPKKISEGALVRGLSNDSILLMNQVAVKGLMDAVRIHHRTKMAGLPTQSRAEVARRFVDYLSTVSAANDDLARTIPWQGKNKENWVVWSQFQRGL